MRSGAGTCVADQPISREQRVELQKDEERGNAQVVSQDCDVCCPPHTHVAGGTYDSTPSRKPLNAEPDAGPVRAPGR